MAVHYPEWVSVGLPCFVARYLLGWGCAKGMPGTCWKNVEGAVPATQNRAWLFTTIMLDSESPTLWIRRKLRARGLRPPL